MNAPANLWWKLDKDPGNLLISPRSTGWRVPLTVTTMQHELTQHYEAEGQTIRLLPINEDGSNNLFAELPEWAMDPVTTFTLAYNEFGLPPHSIVISSGDDQLTIPLATAHAADRFKQWAWKGPKTTLITFRGSKGGRFVLWEQRDDEDVERGWYFFCVNPPADYELPVQIRELGATPADPITL